MSTRYPATLYLAGINATTAAPTAVTDGIPYLGKANNTEALLLVTGHGITAGDDLTIRPWWYDPIAGAWLRGATTLVTDDGAIEAYALGTRIYWQVTAINLTTGTFEMSNQFWDKGN